MWLIGAGGLTHTVSFPAMMPRAQAWWRAMRDRPLWLQLLLSACLVTAGLLALVWLYVLYIVIVIAIFGI